MEKPLRNLPSPETQWLTLEDFEYLCFDFAREFLTFSEPIPDYDTRDNALLDSALGSCQQTFGSQLLYPTLSKQGAVLFYSLIKNHPFKNGNKRIAVMSLLAFLTLNYKWLSLSPDNLYILAKETANSLPENHDQVLAQIGKILINNMIPFPEAP